MKMACTTSRLLLDQNCFSLCNKVVSKRTLTRHQRSEHCKKLQPKEPIQRHKTYNLSMAAQILNISTQCKKRKDESAFSYKLKACDK